MANTYTQLLYHITFSTKNRTPVLQADKRQEMFKYLWGIQKNLNCHLFRMNGVEDHIHILTSLPTTLCVADFMCEIKGSSSKWIKGKNLFENFPGWQDGYAAFTVSYSEKERVIEYVKNQEEHHRKDSYREELRKLLRQAGVEFNEKYLE